MASAEQAESTTKVGHTSTSGRRAGTEVWSPWLAPSRRPRSHPNQHTEAELKLICDQNLKLGMVELWHRLKQRGYTRRPESLFRVMRKLEMFPAKESKNTYKPKPYEQMTYPGQRVQMDVKVVPRRCIADSELRLFQYTAIDEFTRLRFLGAYPEQSTYSSANFLKKW